MASVIREGLYRTTCTGHPESTETPGRLQGGALIQLLLDSLCARKYSAMLVSISSGDQYDHHREGVLNTTARTLWGETRQSLRRGKPGPWRRPPLSPLSSRRLHSRAKHKAAPSCPNHFATTPNRTHHPGIGHYWQKTQPCILILRFHHGTTWDGLALRRSGHGQPQCNPSMFRSHSPWL